MKIVVIGPVYPYRGGIAHSNTLLCLNLSKRHDVVPISFKRLYPKFLFPGKAQKYGEKFKLDLKARHIIDSINPLNWLRIFRIIKKEKPDLVICQWWAIFLAPCSYSILALLKMFTRTKVCILCQNVLQHEERFFDRFLTKAVFRKVDYFVVLSTGDLRDLKKLVPKAKAKILVEPTYDQFFGSQLITKEKARKKLGLKGNVALFFGFVRPYKGLKYLLDAMPIVLKKVDVTLLVVGEFWKGKSEYLKQIRRNNISKNVRVVDRYIPDEDVSLYMVAADVVVLPYTSATQSAILQTAFGFNKPVITTDVGSLSDLVKDNKTGFLVPPKDTRKLAQAIINFYKGKKEKEFIKNIKRGKKTFRWDKEKENIIFHGLR